MLLAESACYSEVSELLAGSGSIYFHRSGSELLVSACLACLHQLVPCGILYICRPGPRSPSLDCVVFCIHSHTQQNLQTFACASPCGLSCCSWWCYDSKWMYLGAAISEGLVCVWGSQYGMKGCKRVLRNFRAPPFHDLIVACRALQTSNRHHFGIMAGQGQLW